PKLHGQRRVVAGAKKGGYLVSCDALSRDALPRWIEEAAREKGHKIAPEEAVAAVVTRVRQSSVWELIDALGARRTASALGTLADVYDPRDGGLRLLGAISWSVRQMVKLDSHLRTGVDVKEAAARAGVPPFKAQDVARTVRSVPPGTLPNWLRLMAETDLALKS